VRRVTVAVGADVDVEKVKELVNELAQLGCIVHVVSTIDVGDHVQWFLDPCDERAKPAYRTDATIIIGVDRSCVMAHRVYVGVVPKDICGGGNSDASTGPNSTDSRS